MPASKVTGDKELLRNLAKIAAAPTGAALDAIVQSALEPMANDIARRAPRQSLKRNIVIVKVAARGRANRRYWISVRRSAIAMRIAHLVEFGTAPHSLAAGASRRYNIMQDVPPFHPGTKQEPYFRPGFEANKEDTVRRAGNGIWAAIVDAVGGRVVR